MAFYQCIKVGGSGDVMDVEVNGTSVVDPTTKIAEIDIPTADEQTATDEFTTINGGLLSECKVTLSPNQDLHGYSEPWVGGASKNKLPLVLADIKANNTAGTWSGNVYSYNGSTITVNTDESGNVTSIDVTNTPSAAIALNLFYASGTFPFDINSTYTLNGCPSGGAGTSNYKLDIIYEKDGINNVLATDTGSGASANFNALVGAISMTCRIVIYTNASLPKTFYPMIRLASESDPAFEPYSNICPISGHTQVEVGDDGKNCLPNDATDQTVSGVEFKKNNDGSLTLNGQSTADWAGITLTSAKFLKAGTYTVSCPRVNSVDTRLIISYDGAEKVNTYNVDYKTFTLTEDKTISVRFVIRNSGVSFSNVTYYPMIEKGSTKTAFVPYNGYQITVNLGGTYYSGTLDVVSGVFIPDTAKIAINTSTIVSISKSGLTDADIFLLFLPSSYKLSEKAILSHYGYKNTQNVNEVGKAWLGTSNTQLRIGFSAYGTTTLEDFKTWLDANNVEGCFELANPTPIQLSPTMVKALVGENNLSAPLDGQEITESKYRELFTWDEVEEIAQQIADSKIDDTRTSNETAFSSFLTESRYAKKVYDVPLLTPWYQKSSGATDITFTNSFIFNDSQTSCELIQIGSGPRVGISNVSISAGSVTFTFDTPLAVDTRFACSIINFY